MFKNHVNSQIIQAKYFDSFSFSPKGNLSNKCALPFKTQTNNVTDTRYMETCKDCPNQYPWLGDAEGTGILGRDNYIYSGASAADDINVDEPVRRK